MISLEFKERDRLAEIHFQAVLDYVSSKSDKVVDELYGNIRKLIPDLPEGRDSNNYDWLRRFILAQPEVLDSWAANNKEDLSFDIFKRLYSNRFSKDSDTFVDRSETYNAYTYMKIMDFHVCPYCDEEYIDIVETSEGMRRTADIDHFLPKGHLSFPALAMCFYNLIPSGKGCNQIMNKTEIEANPYDPSIESYSRFYQDTPVGRNVSGLKDEEVKIRLDTSGKMVRNNEVLGIEKRYNNRTEELRRLFHLKSLLAPENLASMEKTGFAIECIKAAVGKPYPAERGKTIHQKLKHDLLDF